MALKLPSRNETYKVVLRLDSAIGCEPDQYDRYLETLDESLLELKEEPTRFVLRKVLPYRLASGVQDKQFAFKKGEMEVRSSFMLEEVRCSIVGIENPPHLPPEERLEFKADGDGGASEDLMAALGASGLAMDLYRTRQAINAKPNQEAVKKK
jgi:hypothetical protein